MKLAVLSDTHDNIWTLDQAMPHLQEADAVLHCGDLVSASIVEHIAQGVGDQPLHIVWGNCDFDRLNIEKKAAGFRSIQLHGLTAKLELGGTSIAAAHYPFVARDLAESGEYDLVCFGHSHVPHEEWVGDCLLLNPGEIQGVRGKCTMAVVTLPERSVVWIELPAS